MPAADDKRTTCHDSGRRQHHRIGRHPYLQWLYRPPRLTTVIAGTEVQKSTLGGLDMAKYWIAVGIQQNWEAALKGNIWGLRQTRTHFWDSLKEGDTVLFYVTYPVNGVIGYGFVKMKFRQDKPLWPEEVAQNKVIWPLRFEFTVEYCLPPDKWRTDSVTSNELKKKSRGGFQQIEPEHANKLISILTTASRTLTLVGEQKPSYPPHGTLGTVDKGDDSPQHKDLQEKLLEIGKLQNYIAEAEYPFDIGRLDVVWRRVERSVPTYAFEIQIGGDVYHALARLKHAFDLWNTRIFLVAPQTQYDKAKPLIAGTFHEIADQIKFVETRKVQELYKRKKAFIELEKELGI